MRKSGLENLFIKNLDRIVDNKAIYDTFSAFGNILSYKVKYNNIFRKFYFYDYMYLKLHHIIGYFQIVQDPDGKTKGCGFVYFETKEAANKAIEIANRSF